MAIEWVEITVDFDDLPADASDNLRMTLVSPDGVHSEFFDYTIPPQSKDPIALDGGLQWTFTTNRHWGERSGGNVALEIEPGSGIYLPQPWSIEFENWSDQDIHLSSLQFSFYGIDYSEVYQAWGDAAPGGRIQGIAGLDMNGDDDFNFTGLLNDAGEFVRNPTEPLMVEGLYSVDFDREMPASGATIYVDLNLDGLRNDDVQNIVDDNQDGVPDIIEPYFVTGADGNYYFDLPYGTYTVRQELPQGVTLNVNNPLFTEGYTVILDPDDMMTPELEHRELEANFLYTPGEITFDGTVFADLDEDGVQDSFEPGANNFLVFVDLNSDGILQFQDVNFNMQFDIGIDTPLEPSAISAADGSYSISLVIGDEGFEGRGYYTLMLLDRDGWTPIEPANAFYRIFSESGETISLDFASNPELGGITGFVFNDLDGDGVQDVDEFGASGATVFLDQNGDGELGAGEYAFTTDSTGLYSFFDLEFDHYVVQIAALSGWTVTAPTTNGGTYPIDLVAGQVLFGRDFGVVIPIPGDFTGDGIIDGNDLNAWEGGFGTTSDATASDGDTDDDGDVDGNDFLNWQRNYSAGMAGGAAASAGDGGDEGDNGGEAATNLTSEAISGGLSLVVDVSADNTDGNVARDRASVRPTFRPAIAEVFTNTDVSANQSVALLENEPRLVLHHDAIIAPIFVGPKVRLVLGDDAVRFDLALDELDAISPAITAARTKIVEPVPAEYIVHELPLITTGSSHRDSAIRDVIGERFQERSAKQANLLDILVADRLPLEPAAAIEMPLRDWGKS